MLRNDHGNVAIFFALLLPLLLGFVGAGVDYARYKGMASNLQEIADSAALAGAREYVIMSSNNVIPKAVAQQIADSGLATEYPTLTTSALSTSVDADMVVRVDISASFQPSFLVGMYKSPLTVTVDSTAQAIGGANICVIALEENSSGALEMADSAALSGDACAVYSNSSNPNGMRVEDNATLNTVMNCTAGGYRGGAGNYDPLPITDCPVKEDPLSLRPAPGSGACGPGPNVVSSDTTLDPGVYCGLEINGMANVTFTPGTYIIKDGNLLISDQASVIGDGVGFYFEGADSTMTIGPDTTVSLEAPRVGEMAGLLMFQDRDANPNRQFTISSNNAKTLVGTIYLPQGLLYVDATAPVAAQSAYTAIIATKIEMAASVDLVLNSDYAATDVPVPAGLAKTDGEVRIRD